MVTTLLPLAALTYLSLTLATRAVGKEVDSRVRATALVSAAYTEREMLGLVELVNSYSERPAVVSALSNPGSHDRPTIVQHLGQLQQSRPGIATVFMTDPAGGLIDILPPTPSIVGRDFSFRDWYRGVVATGRPYVSESYQSAASGNPRVVAAASPIFAPPVEGQPKRMIGVVVAAYGLETIQAFTEQFAKAQGVHLTVTDQQGVVVATPGSAPSQLGSRRDDPGVAAALDDRSGLRRRQGPGGPMLSAYAPVPSLGWTVSAEVPARTALNAISTLRATVLPIALVLGVVFMGGLCLLLLALRERSRTEKALQESEERTRSILEAADDAFISMDQRGLVTDWNARASATFGWSREEVMGKELAALIIPPEDRQAHRRGLERYLATGHGPMLNTRIEASALHKDGHTFPVELAIWAVHSGGECFFHAFVHDITERKLAQEELASAHEEAMEASRMKSEFLANMSHEIRTPMNGVIGMTGLLLQTELSKDQRESAEIIRSSGEALLTVINDILDFSKIEAGKMTLEIVAFDLRAVVEEAVDLFAERAAGNGVELAALIHPGVPTAVRGDPGRLRQVLVNLVSNAVKFTEAGEVVVRVGLEEVGVGHVALRFEVSDTGIGVSPDKQERLFDSFVQGDASSTRKYGGTGLGLAICKQLVELMGGDIGVSSEMGAGSTFWFTVRLERGQQSNAIPQSDRSSLEGLRVLVVDDNATNRLILDQTLTAWGMAVDCVEGGEEALRLARTNAHRGAPYDLAILDYHMPSMNGVELARALKEDAVTRACRLVLLTSSGQKGEARSAQQVGIEAYLTKPVRQSALFDCLATVVDLEGAAAAGSLVTRHSVVEARAKSRARVLVVEDNPVNQKVASRMLEKLGYRVDVAPNGADGVEAVAQGFYGAVLMDCQMPGMDGYEATRAIRRLSGPASRVPVIAMTAGAMKGDKEKALAAGMDDYITKPVKLDALAALLDQHLQGDRREEPTGPDHDDDALDEALDDAVDDVMDDVMDDDVLDDEVLQELREIGGWDEGLRDLVTNFLQAAEVRLEDLRAAADQGDAATLARLAHDLKGSSSYLGAHRMSSLCHELEAVALAGDPLSVVGVSQLVSRVESEFSQVRVALPAALSAVSK